MQAAAARRGTSHLTHRSAPARAAIEASQTQTQRRQAGIGPNGGHAAVELTIPEPVRLALEALGEAREASQQAQDACSATVAAYEIAWKPVSDATTAHEKAKRSRRRREQAKHPDQQVYTREEVEDLKNALEKKTAECSRLPAVEAHHNNLQRADRALKRVEEAERRLVLVRQRARVIRRGAAEPQAVRPRAAPRPGVAATQPGAGRPTPAPPCSEACLAGMSIIASGLLLVLTFYLASLGAGPATPPRPGS